MPFYLRAGKCLPVTATEVVVELRQPPARVFGDAPPCQPNYCALPRRPGLAIAMGAHAKQPGERMSGREVELYVDQKAPEEMEPYERLIGDAIGGDATLFAREDEVEAAWAVVDPVLNEATPVYEYEPGSWGPAEAFNIIHGECGWHDPGPTAQTGRAGRCALSLLRSAAAASAQTSTARQPRTACQAVSSPWRRSRASSAVACRLRRPRRPADRRVPEPSGVTLTASRPSGRCTLIASLPRARSRSAAENSEAVWPSAPRPSRPRVIRRPPLSSCSQPPLAVGRRLGQRQFGADAQHLRRQQAQRREQRAALVIVALVRIRGHVAVIGKQQREARGRGQMPRCASSR